MKKKLLFIALAQTSFAASAQVGSWVTQATGYATISTGVRNISVVDTNTVWISSYDGSGGAANRQDFSRSNLCACSETG